MSSIKLWHVAGVAIIGLAIVIACASTSRYEVLNFFFDGVPSPEMTTQTETVKPVTVSAFREALDYIARTRTPQPASMAPPIVSVHKPVAEKKCLECHDPNKGFQPIARDAKLCDRCHGEQRQREGWAHGPINLGSCVPCHRSHESQYPFLLEKPVPELCRICHIEDFKPKAAYHDVFYVNDCTVCHDPHLMY
jgi:predicted CXXCH cytochrome family protein